MELREFFTPAVIAAYWYEVYSNRIPYLGRGLFPTQKKAGLDLAWLKGYKGLPVSLMPSAYDAKATFRDRIGFEKLETEMPFFREGFHLKEKDRQELLRIADSNDQYAQQIIARVFDDAANLISGADVVPERMIMQLLFPIDGDVGITIKANGVDYTYDYDPDDAWKAENYTALTSGDLWSNPTTADPIKQLADQRKKKRGTTGTELTTAIMSTQTFNLMAATDAVKNRYLTTTGRSFSYLTDTEILSVIQSTSGFRNILIYDKQYKDEKGVAHAFVPDGYVSLVPDGALGTTWYGTTPEEADLMGSGKAEVSIVNTGVALTRTIDAHPVNLNIFASEIVLPSFERMDEFAVMKVTA